MNIETVKKVIADISELGLIYANFSMEIAANESIVRIEASLDITAELVGLDSNCNNLFNTILKIMSIGGMTSDMYISEDKENTMVYTFSNNNLDIVINVKADTY